MNSPPNLFFYFVLFSLLLFFSLLSASTSASLPELRSLLEFKKGITRDPEKLLDSWVSIAVADSTAACPTTWHGIVCDEESGNITGIVLDHLALGGDLKFHTLLDLKMLRNLSLAGNDFTGRLPPSLGSLSSLQHLDLSQNNFYGPIPARINDLWALNYLNLSNNQFKGGFPSGLNNLQQLRVLDLHANHLWAEIGDVLSTLRNVERVDLSRNKFFGGLALPLDNVSGLANTVHFLNLSHNNLNGPFFKNSTIALFRNLQVLDLTNNSITGHLPSFGSLPALRVLRLPCNLLFGSLPQDLFYTSLPLQELDLSVNAFTGSITVINSTTLNILNLSSNSLSGSLPTSVRRCTIIDLSRNMLSGDISVIQNWEASLEVIDLSSNKLSGSLPPILGTYSKLSTVDLSLNELKGSIPQGLVTSLSVTRLNLSGNQFTGQLLLQGSGASELLLMPPSQPMEYLDVSNNSLEGVLPSEIGRMAGLKLLNLARNGFSGQLPNELNKLFSLEYLDLSNNKFTGNIPDKLSSSLTVFNVSNNDLSGHVPENLQQFPPLCFRPGNVRLVLPNDPTMTYSVPDNIPDKGRHHSSKGNIRIAIILASVGAAIMIAFVLLAYHRTQLKEFHGRSDFTGQNARRDVKLGGLSRSSLFKFNTNVPDHSSHLNPQIDMSTSDKAEVVERGSKDEKHKEDDQEEGKGGFIEKVKDFIHDIGEKIEEAIGFGKPTADVTGVHIPSINLHKADLVVDVLIKNPNPVPIPLIDIDYLVESDGRKLVSGLIPDAGTIHAHGEQTVNIPLTLIYDDIKQTYDDIKPGSIIPYRVKVGLIFDVPILGRLTLPLEKTGEIPIPYKPDVDLEKIHFERFSFEETVATLHLKLENKNDFDLGLNALDYEVWLGDVSIGGAELTKSAKIQKTGITYIDIPITFRPKDFGSALWDMIRGRGTGYTLKGHIDVDTPFGAMKLPISKEGGTTRLKKKKEDRDYDDDEDDED